MNKRVQELAQMCRIHVRAYSPGDGVTRYRFFEEPHSYFEADGIYTALGAKEAETFLRGFWRGMDAARRRSDPPSISRRESS